MRNIVAGCYCAVIIILAVTGIILLTRNCDPVLDYACYTITGHNMMIRADAVILLCVSFLLVTIGFITMVVLYCRNTSKAYFSLP